MYVCIYIYIYIRRLLIILLYPVWSTLYRQKTLNLNFVSVDDVCVPYQLITSLVTVTLLASR